MKTNSPHIPEYTANPYAEYDEYEFEDKAYKKKESHQNDIFKSFTRYALWCVSVLLLAFLCNLLAFKISGIPARSLAALWYEPSGLTLRNSFLFFILPITLYWVILLCGPWNDPFRARFYGIIAGVMMVFFVSTFTFILYAANIAQGADPAVDLSSLNTPHIRVCLIIAAVFFELLFFLGYFIGPHRLARSKWKDEDADMTTR